MTANDINEIKSIISDLKREFSNEEERLSTLERERTIRLDELEHQISSAKKNEDIDFRVFSPRNVNSSITEKISGMEEERKKLEQLLGESSRQKIYYSGKTEKLARVLELLSDSKSDIDKDSVDEISVEDKSEDDSFDWFSQFDKSSVKSDNDTSGSADSEDVTDESPVKTNTVEEPVSSSDNSFHDKIINNVTYDNDKLVRNLNKVVHKAQLGEKVIDNDRRRAHMVIKEVIDDLKDILKCFT